MRNIPYALLLLSLLSYACVDDDMSNQDTCATNLICTEEYRVILVALETNRGAPIRLDRYTVTATETGEMVSFNSFSPFDVFDVGSYVIAEDSQLESVAMDGTAFTFEGFIDGQMLVSESFLIGHDCCHVVKLEGPDTVVVNF